MRFPTEKEIDRIKNKYPEGTCIKLIRSEDPSLWDKSGAEGIVQYVDDIGTVHVAWEHGSYLGVIPGVDCFEVIKPVYNNESAPPLTAKTVMGSAPDNTEISSEMEM